MAGTASTSSPATFDGDYSFINVVPDGNSWADWSKAPKTRKRITKDQLEMLEAHFRITSHPSREERQMLALKTGMELRSVTIWLQNKRQIVKKTAKAAAEAGGHSESSSSPSSSSPSLPNAPPRTTISPTPGAASRGSANPRPSLDRVASLSEIQSPVRPIKFSQSQEPQPLWSHMPSSPPSSPPSGSQPPKRTRSLNNGLHKVTGRPYPALSRTASVDSAVTVVSSSSQQPRETRSRLSKPGFTLEWACAQAAARPLQDDEGGSTEEDDCTLSQASQSTVSVADAGVPASSDEMEAALALCGLLRG